MIKIKKYQIEDYISDATQDALDLKADLVDGKVPASQLPSFVDDVIEVANYAALPIPGSSGVIYITLDTNKVYRWSGSVYVEIASGVTNLSYTPGVSNGTVNSDTGTDATIPLAGTVNAGLFSAAEKSKLEGIAPNANVGVIPNAPITGATKTKITYDSKGLVTAGVDATTADIADSTNKRYVTDANLTVINNTSGTNTGDQNLQQVTDNGATTTNSITADSFIKSGGLATEYLMADGTTTTGGGGDFVPYTGATSNVNLGEFGIQLGNLEFDNTPTNIPTTAGSMYYNDADGTLDLILKGGNVKLQIGQETVIRVVNKTATNISLLESNYQAVRITGAQGQRPKVDLAQATNDELSSETIGLVTETIANNQEGFITTSGLVRNINTTGSLQGETWLDGDILYLSSTVAGNITKVKPVAPNHLIIIGYVIHAHITQGTIFVKVDNGYELNELHNVKINGVANNNVLAYTSSTSIWENKTIATALGYTPANDASVVHLTGNETISGLKTFTDNLTAGRYLYSGGSIFPEFGQTFYINGTGATHYFGGGTSNAQNNLDVPNGTLKIGLQTASTIASFDANKNIVSLTTANGYPTLTELKSLVGVSTTAIQTQLNGKQDTLTSGTNIRTVNGSTLLGSTNLSVGTVTSVTGTAPIVSSGGTTPAISMAAATGSVDGYLTAANWTTFNNKLDANTWIDYSSISTIVGWSAYTTKTIKYTISGKLMFIQYNILGTSNSSATSFTLPFSSPASSIQQSNNNISSNNSTVYMGYGLIGVSSSLVTFYYFTTAANQTSTWTASGNKSVRGILILEIA